MARKAKTIIHVNQHVIKANRKSGERNPVLTVKSRGKNTYAHEVAIYGQDGKLAAKVIYSPDKPLSCGAHVWIETTNDVVPTVSTQNPFGLKAPEEVLTVEKACKLAGVDFLVSNGGETFKCQTVPTNEVFENTLGEALRAPE